MTTPGSWFEVLHGWYHRAACNGFVFSYFFIPSHHLLQCLDLPTMSPARNGVCKHHFCQLGSVLGLESTTAMEPPIETSRDDWLAPSTPMEPLKVMETLRDDWLAPSTQREPLNVMETLRDDWLALSTPMEPQRVIDGGKVEGSLAGLAPG